MRCPSCGTEAIAGKRFCHACGARLEIKCGSCGAAVELSFHFCPDCGAPIVAAAAEPAGAPSPPVDDRLARLSRHIPEGLAQKIRATTSAILGERKLVTVLFCDLVGSTAIAERLDPEEYRDLLDQYLEIAFREIYRFEGIVNQLAGDGMMALFGAPVAHEDSPHRAVRAALEIRDALASFNRERSSGRGIELRLRIGIHSGPVVVGTVGNDFKMDYTAIGDTTNLASRLQSLAEPGTILMSEATYRLVRGFFDVAPAGPYEVKGKSDLVRAYDVFGLSAASTPMDVAEARGLTPLVARGEELTHLDACFERLAGHLPQVVAIVGETGSGKSRLIYEFKQQVADRPVVFFEARCSSLSHNVPYSPFASMLRQYFGITVVDDLAAAREKVASRVRPWDEQLDRLYPFLCSLLSLPVEGLADRPEDELKRDIFEAVAHLVVAVSQQSPVVMIIEDLDWIDDSSREILDLAVAKLQRVAVMLVVSHRPDYQRTWRVSAALTQLHLRMLDEGDVASIIRAIAGGSLPAELERQIIAKAEGSPFFAEEITRALLEEGDLARDDGHTRLTRPMEEIRIPGTVQEVIAARIDRLRGTAKRVVQVASVLGRQFRRGQLAELLATEGIDVSRELEELEERGILHRKTILSSDEYRFGESMTQEVAYESLLLKERRQLHERVAKMIEASAGPAPAERSALLAHHYGRSEDRSRAVEAFLAAARDAEKLPSYRAAVTFYRQAWEAADVGLEEHPDADEHFRRLSLAAALGLCRMTVFYSAPVDPGNVDRAAQRGEELAQSLGDTETLANLYALHGMITTAKGPEKFPQGLALVEKALAVASQAGLTLPVVSISRALAWTYLLDGRFQQAREKIDWVMAELERAGHRERLSDVYFGARWFWTSVRAFGDDLAPAEKTLMETVELAVQANNRTAHAGSAAGLAQIHMMRGEYTEAKRWADRSLDIAQAIDNVSAMRIAASIAVTARRELGEPVEAPRYLELLDQGLALTGTLPLSIRVIVEGFLALGEPKRAQYAAQVACERAGGRLSQMLAAEALGEAELRLGPDRWSEAACAFDRAIALADELGSRSTLAIALLGAAELAAAKGNRERSAPMLERALTIARRLGLTRYLERADRILAMLDAGPQPPA